MSLGEGGVLVCDASCLFSLLLDLQDCFGYWTSTHRLTYHALARFASSINLRDLAQWGPPGGPPGLFRIEGGPPVGPPSIFRPFLPPLAEEQKTDRNSEKAFWF